MAMSNVLDDSFHNKNEPRFHGLVSQEKRFDENDLEHKQTSRKSYFMNNEDNDFRKGQFTRDKVDHSQGQNLSFPEPDFAITGYRTVSKRNPAEMTGYAEKAKSRFQNDPSASDADKNYEMYNCASYIPNNHHRRTLNRNEVMPRDMTYPQNMQQNMANSEGYLPIRAFEDNHMTKWHQNEAPKHPPTYGNATKEYRSNNYEFDMNFVQPAPQEHYFKQYPPFHYGREDMFKSSSGSRIANGNFGGYRSHHKIKPPTFSGQSHEWQYFKRLFTNAAIINNWSEEEKLYNLLNAMQDEAKSFIVSIETQLSNLSFMGLITLMDHRFGAGNGSPHYQSLLESKVWRFSDNLRTYLDDVRRLVMLSYPEVQGWAQQESLVRKHFINGVADMTLKQKLLIDPPNSVDAAVQYAERYVAAKTATDASKRAVLPLQRDRVRMVRPENDLSEEEEENGEEDDDLVVEMVNLLKSKGFTNKKPVKRDLTSIKCFNCGGMGHYRRECPSPSLNTKQPSSEAKKEAASTHMDKKESK